MAQECNHKFILMKSNWKFIYVRILDKYIISILIMSRVGFEVTPPQSDLESRISYESKQLRYGIDDEFKIADFKVFAPTSLFDTF